MNEDSYMKRNFYTYKDGSYCPIFKEDIQNSIDVFRPQSIIPWCKIFDIPFILSQWCYILSSSTIKCKLDGKLFGKYLAWMKLPSFRSYTFKDTEQLNKLDGININEIETYRPQIEWKIYTSEEIKENNMYYDEEICHLVKIGCRKK